MAAFTFTSPSGQSYTVNGPEGATQDQAFAMLQQQLAPPSPIAVEQRQMGASLARGLEDIPEGGAQLLAHGAAAVVPQAQPLATGMDQFISGRETSYGKNFPGGQPPSFDIGRGIGNMIGGAPVAAVMPGAAAESLGVRLLSAIGGGVLTGAMQPASGTNFWTQKGKQALAGGIGGAAGPLATGAVARTVLPNAATNADLQLLRGAGVTPSLGQTAGGWLNRFEQSLTGIPGTGDMISNARRGGVESFNRAMVNSALSPIDESINAGTKIGRAAINEMHTKIGEAYDNLLPKMVWQSDEPFMQSFGQIRSDLFSTVPQTEQAQFDSNIRRVFNFNKASGGLMSGQAFKDSESELGTLAKEFMGSTDPNQRALGKAFKDVQFEMRNALTRSNPQYAPELANINAAYARSQAVEGAAGMLGAKDGIFSPAQYANAVRSQSRRVSKSAYARGTAAGQNFSDAAQSVLGNTVPDSGTPSRMFAAMAMPVASGAIPYGEYLLPFTGANVVGMGAYTRPVQGLLSNLLAARPNAAVPLAKAVRAMTPAATAFGGALAGQQIQP